MFDNIYYKQLQCGLKIVILQRKIQSNTICLRGIAGSNYESKTQIGCAHFLEHAHTSPVFYEKYINPILKYGGRITGTTSRDDVAYLVKSLKEYYRHGLEYLIQIFCVQNFGLTNIDLIKESIIQEIRQNNDDPKKFAARYTYKNLYPNQRFAILNTGREEDIRKITPSNLYEFKQKYYFPSNFVLSVCGDINPDEFVILADSYLGKNTTTEKKIYTTPKYRQNDKLNVQLYRKDDLNQLHLKLDYYGVDSSNQQKYSYVLLANILKKRIIRYFINSSFISNYALDIDSFSSNTYGLFGMYACFDSKYLKSFIVGFRKCLHELAAKNIYENEVNIIKNKIYCDIVFNLEKTSIAADYYSEMFLYKQCAGNHIEELNNIINCPVSEIGEVANQIALQNPKITILVNNSFDSNDINKIWD